AMNGQCLLKPLPLDGNGQVACVVIEATRSESCDCNATARAPVAADHQCYLDSIKQQPGASDLTCFCEIEQTAGAATKDCALNQSVQGTTNGFCYVDGTN